MGVSFFKRGWRKVKSGEKSDSSAALLSLWNPVPSYIAPPQNIWLVGSSKVSALPADSSHSSLESRQRDFFPLSSEAVSCLCTPPLTSVWHTPECPIPKHPAQAPRSPSEPKDLHHTYTAIPEEHRQAAPFGTRCTIQLLEYKTYVGK